MNSIKCRVCQDSNASAYNEGSSSESDTTVDATTYASVSSLCGDETWTDFQKAFDTYSNEIMQTYAKWTFTTRVAQNNRIEARYSAKDEQPPDAKLFMDESYYYYLVVFVCIQAGKHQDRGNGKWPRQHVHSIGCGAQGRDIIVVLITW
ncbi:hypothetical protein PC128_g23440 [Phytophthora cactorum]|nr:hypothetical protein PC120_g24631 [Phytophthora cactorum]KAG3045650.1 hypothetical protein PC121_g21137 [Phytophthora cactorum]KAG3149230.1 hypothetical protein PC128_g23440 [Phytophthora cactorum]KAG4041954.1 hypothetical protein PC123_g22544 [Phytophthora cactorum]